ncbi:hypothetical protein [Paraglaciecola arctica]|nr:hypothetical protein [Paraglaciecola arctica]
MKELFTKAKQVVSSKLDIIVSELDSGMKMVKEVVNGLPIFVSLEHVDNDKVEYDENVLTQSPITKKVLGYGLFLL